MNQECHHYYNYLEREQLLFPVHQTQQQLHQRRKSLSFVNQKQIVNQTDWLQHLESLSQVELLPQMSNQHPS